MRGAIVLAPLVLVGCSLLGLGDYPIPACQREANGIDPCASLCQNGCSECERYQCDPATQRCTLSLTDADGDGDPAKKCGGSDCNDGDARRSGTGRAESLCDGIDNNCDERVDEGLVRGIPAPSLFSTSATLTDLSVVRDVPSVGAIASGVLVMPGVVSCIVVGSDVAPRTVGDCATFAVSPGSPAQPYSRYLGTGFPPVLVTVFTRIDACDVLALRSAGAGAESTCAEGPRSLPSIIGVVDTVGTTATDALVTFYATPIAATCATSVAAPLQLAQVDATTTSRPIIDGPPKTLSGRSRSVRPASLVAARKAGILIAAPDEDAGAMLWLLHQITGDLEIASFPVPIAGARSVDVQIVSSFAESPNGTDDVAIVAETGCPPAQSVVLALGRVSYFAGVPTAFALGSVQTLWSGATAANASPTVTWAGAPYEEWRVAWTTADGVMMARFDSKGKAVGAPFFVADKGVQFAAQGSQSNVIYAGTGGLSTIQNAAIGCLL